MESYYSLASPGAYSNSQKVHAFKFPHSTNNISFVQIKTRICVRLPTSHAPCHSERMRPGDIMWAIFLVDAENYISNGIVDALFVVKRITANTVLWKILDNYVENELKYIIHPAAKIFINHSLAELYLGTWNLSIIHSNYFVQGRGER